MEDAVENNSSAAVYKSAAVSEQYIKEDTRIYTNVVSPFVDFSTLLNFYYYNTYHRRAIHIKSRLLSRITETDLKKHLPQGTTPTQFMQQFTLDAEIYGNSFIEKAGFNTLYWIPGYEARITQDRKIVQVTANRNKVIPLEGYHFRNVSPRSRYYGEADYLTILDQIDITKKADDYNKAFFDNGARPGMIISFENSEPNDKQKTGFTDFFRANYKGVGNAHKSLILWTGTKREGEQSAKIHIDKLNEVEDLSFKQLKEVNRDEIIAAHGVPPRLVGVMAAGQLGGGSELIDQMHAFNEIEIKPKAQQYEEFFDSIGIKHKIEPMDVSNFKDDASLVDAFVRSGILSAQEAKEIMGYDKK